VFVVHNNPALDRKGWKKSKTS